jgi:hypothetical protein
MKMTRVFAMFAAVAAVLILGSTAYAQEGTLTGMWYKSGTFKALPAGDQIVILVIDESGMVVADRADSPLNNNSGHCVGLGRFLNSIGHFAGNCLFVDPKGDQFILDWDSTDYKMGEVPKGSVKFLGGTGKFKGMTGTGEWQASTNEVHAVADGTYQGWSKLQWHYKLAQ